MSARATCFAPASASLYTAAERMPRRFSVEITRQAISPRFATSTVPKGRLPGVVMAVTS
jgi:hypothetical protein